MNEERPLLDTSLVSHYLAPDAPARLPHLVTRVDDCIRSHGLCLSIITTFEIGRGLELLRLRGRGSTKISRFTRFLSEAAAFPLDGRVLQLGCDLWARGRIKRPAITLSDGDLLIAATAIAHEHKLLTTDVPLGDRLMELELGDHVEVIALR